MAEKKVLIDNKSVALSETKVQFGALNAPTPQWAKWFFRVWSIVTTGVAIYIAGSQFISMPAKTEILLFLKASDPIVLGISKMFGIVEK